MCKLFKSAFFMPDIYIYIHHLKFWSSCYDKTGAFALMIVLWLDRICIVEAAVCMFFLFLLVCYLQISFILSESSSFLSLLCTFPWFSNEPFCCQFSFPLCHSPVCVLCVCVCVCVCVCGGGWGSMCVSFWLLGSAQTLVLGPNLVRTNNL